MKTCGDTYLVHFHEPLEHDVLLVLVHRSQRVEEIAIPHDGRVHDDLVDHVVGLGNQLTVLVPLDPAAVSDAHGSMRGTGVLTECGIRGWLLFAPG